MADTIAIYDNSDVIYKHVPLTDACEWTEELMQSDQGVLSWKDNTNTVIPAGYYIRKWSHKYKLLAPYTPKQIDECTWEYMPVFESVVRSWAKIPFFHYNYLNDKIDSKEPDWQLTDTPTNFMRSIIEAIKQETGETWTYNVAKDLEPTKTISFQSTSILAALTDIANAFETEWIAYKDVKLIRLGKINKGSMLSVKVGDDLPLPSIKDSTKEYYNCFYAYGSTRNITQDYKAASTNNLVNKRLTLDPEKYPDGCKDIRKSKQEPLYATILTFDEIYPKSALKIADVRARLMYRLEGKDRIIIGYDTDGNPIYDQYAIWYFRIPGFNLINKTYDKDNPDGMLIANKKLSAHFKGGMLTGREFELRYYETDQTITDSYGEQFHAKAGDYEIQFIEDDGFIVPSMLGITPSDGDEIILFNIRMPDEYVLSAQEELEVELNKEIAERQTDKNSYSFHTYYLQDHPDEDIFVGRNVALNIEDKVLESRIIKLVTKMDYNFDQEWTIGNEVIKGNTQQLKEEIVNANKNIDVLAELNALTQSVTQGYERTTQYMLDGFNRIGQMWQFDNNGNIFTPFNAYSQKSIAALGQTSQNDSTVGNNTIGAVTLGGLTNVDTTCDSIFPTSSQILIKNKGADKWTPTSIDKIGNVTSDMLTSYITKTDAAQLYQPKGSYLTTHQKLYSTTYKAGKFSSSQTYNPGIGEATVNIPTTTSHIAESSDGLYYTDERVKKAMSTDISKISNSLTNHQTQLDSKLDTTVFNDLFTKVTLPNNTIAIRANYSLFTYGSISSFGISDSDITGGANVETITNNEIDSLFP